MDPAVRQSLRTQAGIEATQDAISPGWLLQLNSNVTGSVNMHDGYAHYTSEAVADNGLVLTQDRRIYTALMNSGMYSVSSTRNVGTYMKAALALNPVSYWRLGETGNYRVALDLAGGTVPNLISNYNFSSGLTGFGDATSTYSPASDVQMVDPTDGMFGKGCARIAVTGVTASSAGDRAMYSLASDYANPVGNPGAGDSAYTLSVWMRGTPGRSIYARAVRRVGATTEWGSYDYLTTVTATGEWQQVVVSIPASSGLGTTSIVLRIGLRWSGTQVGDFVSIDSLLLYPGSAAPPTTYVGPVVDVSVPPNLVTNPLTNSSDLAGWSTNPGGGSSSPQSVAMDSSVAGIPNGTAAAKVVTNAANQGIAVSGSNLMNGNLVVGRPYTFSVYLKGNAGGERVQLQIGTAFVSVLLTTAWQRFSFTTLSFSGSNSFTPLMNCTTSGATFWVNGVQLVQSSSVPASFYEGNGGNDGDYINTVPNLISNPSFESDLTGWSSSVGTGGTISAVQSSGWASSGSYSALINATLPSTGTYAQAEFLATRVPATPGLSYTASINYNVTTFPTGASSTAEAWYADSTGATIGSTHNANLTAGTGRAVMVMGTAPANAAYIYMAIFPVYSSTSSGQSVTVYLDAAMITATASSITYSDTQGVTLGQAGVVSGGGDTDTAILLDGQSGYVSTPLLVNYPAFTFSIWVKMTNEAHQGTLFDHWAGNGYLVRVESNGSVTFYTHSDNVPADYTNLTTASGLITVGQWHHVVATFDGSYRRVYIDGLQKTADNSAVVVYAPTTGNLKIGGPYTYITGTIDEPAVYNHALSASQVSTLYASR